MARNYDRLIRFYDSWFDDLLDEDKGFTPAEILEVLVAIRNAQRSGSTDTIKQLPKTIKRGLAMASLVEQVERIIERVDNARARSQKGAQAQKLTLSAASAAAAQEQEKRKAAREQYEKSMADFYRMILEQFGISSYEFAKLEGNQEELLRKIYAADKDANSLSWTNWIKYRNLTYFIS